MDEMNNKIAMIKCNKCLMTDRKRRALGTQWKKVSIRLGGHGENAWRR